MNLDLRASVPNSDRRPVVFDTSTLIACCLHPDRQPAKLLIYAARHHDLIASKASLSELISVLRRDKFDRWRSEFQRTQFVESFIGSAKIIRPQLTINDCRDQRDNKFIELALSAGTRCMLVSSDQDLLVLAPYRSIQILSVEGFSAFSGASAQQ